MIGTATLNGALLATNWIAALGGPILGLFGDRIGRERIILIAAPLSICMVLLLAFPGNLALTLLWLPAGFISAAAVGASSDALAGDLAPRDRRSTVMSRYATWQDLGSALGPFIGYLALGATSLTWVYAGNACLMGISISWCSPSCFRERILRRYSHPPGRFRVFHIDAYSGVC